MKESVNVLKNHDNHRIIKMQRKRIYLSLESEGNSWLFSFSSSVPLLCIHTSLFIIVINEVESLVDSSLSFSKKGKCEHWFRTKESVVSHVSPPTTSNTWTWTWTWLNRNTRIKCALLSPSVSKHLSNKTSKRYHETGNFFLYPWYSWLSSTT